jgi:hypothetical protein
MPGRFTADVRMTKSAFILATLFASPNAWTGVVINEIFYNAPDDLEDLQWIEIYNDGDGEVDLSGWKLDDGALFAFPAGTKIGAHECVVLALDPARFTESYGGHAIGPLKRPLKRGGEQIVLTDPAGRKIDVARYKDGDPWPESADGHTASIERICPSAPGDVPENWAASPLSPADTKPGGTPGKQNAGYAASLPPVIKLTSGAPDDLAPEQSLRVEAEVKDERLREVNLLYRIVVDGVEDKETAVPMARDAATGRYRAEIPGQKAGALVRYRIEAKAEGGVRRFFPAEHDLRPTLSVYVHDKWATASISFGFILRGGADRPTTETPRRGDQRRFGRGPAPNFGGFGRRAPAEPRPPRGSSAFVHVAADTGKTTLFDHINIVARNNDRGFKIFFNEDRPFRGMRSLNMIFEGSEWSLLAEALAFDLYRRSGSPAPFTEFVRLWLDGRMVGYHLAVERINASFLRRNEIAGGGNLYKMLWTGRDVVGQHEKKTNKHLGHDDVLSITDRLGKTSGDEQWKLIQEDFNVDQVAIYFAVNMVLSHWDGFFNNYFPYHDTKNGKWEMYPWDQDKTWGYYDGLPDDQVFFDMPLTFGMAGDRPPGNSGGGFGPRGPMWWRPGGHFSRPLLANPRFRKVFLARTREILEKTYTKEVYFPLIGTMAKSLEEDVRLRAEATGRSADAGTQEFARNVELLKTHLIKRREFLLEQEEIQTLEPKINQSRSGPGGGPGAPGRSPGVVPVTGATAPGGDRNGGTSQLGEKNQSKTASFSF